MKTIVSAISFFAVAYSVAGDADTKTSAQQAREIERVALFLREKGSPEEQLPGLWKRPDVQKQWQRNEQWKDDSKNFDIMKFFLSETYASLPDCKESQSNSCSFSDEFGNTKFLGFKKKDGFITEFAIYTLEKPSQAISFSDNAFNQQIQRYQLKCYVSRQSENFRLVAR